MDSIGLHGEYLLLAPAASENEPHPALADSLGLSSFVDLLGWWVARNHYKGVVVLVDLVPRRELGASGDLGIQPAFVR